MSYDFFFDSCYEEIFGGVIVGEERISGEEDLGGRVMDKDEESYAMGQG